VSTQAILKSVQRVEKAHQMELFAEPDLPLDKRIEFYQHEMEWANRLILGDSLHVMNSLLERELMAGRVQMIYMDPPYGIKYASNFQPHINRREVKDVDQDLTREPEQVKAYRDTWELGIHSYLTYLRDRLLLCRELLHESGSIFVQINDENLHLVRNLLDEVFGRKNFCSLIQFRKTGYASTILLPNICDYILWYAKDREQLKHRPVFLKRVLSPEDTAFFDTLESPEGERRALTREERLNTQRIPEHYRILARNPLVSPGYIESLSQPIQFEGKEYVCPPNAHWKTTPSGIARLKMADRLIPKGNTLRMVRYLEDFAISPLTNIWTDTGVGGFVGDIKIYAVQTDTRVIQRCTLMTTDPGDLVFDPTCGSGTTAHCAEKWGRRWITCDTSRVALAIARQRLMTARFDCYELADPYRGPAGGFIYETLPHITLESIANNAEIDEIVAKFQPQIDNALMELNEILGKNWKEWEISRETDTKWPEKVKRIHERFWTLKLQKRRAIDESIRRNAKQELLWDDPITQGTALRVSGPFTVEAIPIPVMQEESTAYPPLLSSASVATDHVDLMVKLLQKSGITFPGGKQMTLEALRPISSAGFVQAEGETMQNGIKVRVAVSFGPRHGPVTAKQVDDAIRSSYKMGFDVLILAGFAFDPEAQATIQKNPIPKLKVHLSYISPDVIVGDLLKTTRGSQLFTVFGQPDIKLERNGDWFVVKLLGVDFYNPETGEVHSSSAGEIPAWFLDEDYDGYTFRICQAFFPREATAKDPWDRLENALRAVVDKEKMEMFRGTESLPFKAGQEKRIAVKVIDSRGNEVMVVKSLGNRKE